MNASCNFTNTYSSCLIKNLQYTNRQNSWFDTYNDRFRPTMYLWRLRKELLSALNFWPSNTARSRKSDVTYWKQIIAWFYNNYMCWYLRDKHCTGGWMSMCKNLPHSFLLFKICASSVMSLVQFRHWKVRELPSDSSCILSQPYLLVHSDHQEVPYVNKYKFNTYGILKHA